MAFHTPLWTCCPCEGRPSTWLSGVSFPGPHGPDSFFCPPSLQRSEPRWTQTCRMVKGRQDQVPTHAVPWHLLSPDSLTEEKKKNQGFIRSQKLKVCVIPSQNMYPLKKCIRLNTFTYCFLHLYWSMVAYNSMLIPPVQQMSQLCAYAPYVAEPLPIQGIAEQGWRPPCCTGGSHHLLTLHAVAAVSVC